MEPLGNTQAAPTHGIRGGPCSEAPVTTVEAAGTDHPPQTTASAERYVHMLSQQYGGCA